MEIREAIKAGKAIEVETDTYLLEDNRIVKYDRYFGRSGRQAKWVDDEGWAYKNFCDAYYESHYLAVRA